MGDLVPKIEVTVVETPKIETPKDFGKPVFVPDAMKPNGPIVAPPPGLAKGTSEQMTVARDLQSNPAVKYVDLGKVMSQDLTGKTYMAHQMLQSPPTAKTLAILTAVFGVLGVVMEPTAHSWLAEHFGSLLGFVGLPMLGMVMGGRSNKTPSPIPESLVEDFAKISDQALDQAYGYGLSKPGTFGWEANQGSARKALELLASGVSNVEQISSAIHEGWAEVARTYEDPVYQTKPEKKANRLKLADTPYEDLAESEKEKDRVAARALIKAHYRWELKGYGEQYQLPGLEGRVERGLDPAGMLAVSETRGKVERVASKLGAKMEDVISLTNDLHVGGVWKNADRLAAGTDPALQVWMILGDVTVSGKQKEGDLTEAEFLADTDRVNGLLDQAAADPQGFAARSKQTLIDQSKQKFVMDGDVPVSQLDDGFVAMAVNGYRAGIVKAANGLLFVGAEDLDYTILERMGLRPEVREDRGRKATFYVDEKGEAVVKKLYDGYALVLSKDLAVAKNLARTGEAQVLVGRAEKIEQEAEIYFIEGWDGAANALQSRAQEFRQKARDLLTPFFKGNDGHSYKVRAPNDFSERAALYRGEHVYGRKTAHHYLGEGRIEVTFQVYDTEVSFRREKGAREVKITMSASEFNDLGLKEKYPSYYVLTPDYPASKSPITLGLVGDRPGFGYLLYNKEGEAFLSIDTNDRYTAESIQLQVLENYEQTGSLEMAVDWLKSSPWDPGLFTTHLPADQDLAPFVTSIPMNEIDDAGPPEITVRSDGGRDYRIVTQSLTDRYYPHTTLVWVKDPSDIVLQPDGKISVTFHETLTDKKLSFTLSPSEAEKMGIRPGQRPETYFTLWK